MATPPLTTLILNSSPFSVVGIDTQFFEVNALLRGIKLIPKGVHLFHYSESTQDGVSMRYGRWFECKDGDIVSVDFSEEKCQFTVNVNPPATLAADYAFMVVYPEDSAVWTSLSKFVDSEAIDEYVPANNTPISTATPLKEENMVLVETLRERDPKQTFEDQTGKELRYTIVQFRLRAAESHSDRDITQNSLEKSWYVTQLFGHDPELLLAEILISFVHFVVLGNLCSCTQWLTLLRLVLMSPQFLHHHRGFGADFMALLHAQLEKLPREYMAGLQVVGMQTFAEVMENLAYINDSTWSSISEVNQRRFGLEISPKNVDANNFEVYDMEDYDEDDEDAPAVIMTG